jgi:hypothetical protein
MRHDGVARVIGMKPTLRSFFSIARLGRTLRSRFSAGIASAQAPSSADRLQKARRAASFGNTARIAADATTPSARHSSLAGAARKCVEIALVFALVRCRPHAQPAADGAAD